MAEAATVPMAAAIEMWTLDRLVPYAKNARTHSDEQILQIARSIVEFGFNNPVLVDSEAGIVAGHGRLLACRFINAHPELFHGIQVATVPVVVLDHLNATQRRAYVIADNRLAELAGWDNSLLAAEIADLQLADFDVTITGWNEDDQRELLALVFDGDDEAAGGVGSDGSLLSLVDVTIAEPTHTVSRGDIWQLGKHVLLCVSVVTDWSVWTKYLNADDALFCPFPGPLIPLGVKAGEHVLVLVQPEPYIAGHIVDRYCDVHGEAAARKVGSA